jgi:hypothetical protein
LVSISEQSGYREDPRFSGIMTFVAENRAHGYFWIISPIQRRLRVDPLRFPHHS